MSKRIARIEEAVPDCLSDQERLIVCLPDTTFFRFNRARRGQVGWLTASAIAVTNDRVLFFGLRRGWLDLVDAPARHEVEVVERKTGRWRGGDIHVDVLVLRIRGETTKFSFTQNWSERGALAARALSTRDPT